MTDPSRRYRISLHLPAFAFLAAAAVALTACGPGAEDPAAHEEGAAEQPDIAVVDTSYPLDWCPVSKEQLGSMGEPMAIDHDGREIKLCCDGCLDDFNADAEQLLVEVDAAIIEQQKADYPLNVCVVAGERLGSMGEPYDLVHNNRLVRFCCAGCDEQFYRHPEGHLEAIAAGKVYQGPATGGGPFGQQH